MPAMQEQLQAMARERMAPMPCGFHLGMAGMPAMQEQLQAMARERMAPMPCGFHLGMAGMPAMQEQLQAMARGRTAVMQEQLQAMAMDGGSTTLTPTLSFMPSGYASGRGRECRSNCRRWPWTGKATTTTSRPSGAC